MVLRRALISLLPVAAAVVLCVHYVDLPVARAVADLLRGHMRLMAATGRLPDLLSLLVWSLTAVSWSGYFWLRRRGDTGRFGDLLRLVGTALPLAFAVKTLLKELFGRVNTRAWLFDPSLHGFHWFHGGGDFYGFPSGHMAVITPLLLALIHYYPRWRRECLAILGVLAALLVLTDYHFVSDVIAGAWVGVLVDELAHGFLRLWDRRPARAAKAEPR